MDQSRIKFSIVIPAFGEAKLIESSLESLKHYLDSEKILQDCEVIVVSANSGDDTARRARKFKSQFHNFNVIEPGPKVGKGRDVRLGMLASHGDYVLFMDADLATPLKYVKEAFSRLESGEADVVIGERVLKNIHNGKRLIGSIWSNFLIRAILLPGYKDTQCGFKGFTAQASYELFRDLQTTGWGFDLEILVRARGLHYNVKKILIPDWKDPKDSDTGLVGESSLKAFYSTFKELLTIRWRELRGGYRR